MRGTVRQGEKGREGYWRGEWKIKVCRRDARRLSWPEVFAWLGPIPGPVRRPWLPQPREHFRPAETLWGVPLADGFVEEHAGGYGDVQALEGAEHWKPDEDIAGFTRETAQTFGLSSQHHAQRTFQVDARGGQGS